MMKKNGCIEFIFFIDLLTPKENKYYKCLINNKLFGVKFGVNLGQNAISLTQKNSLASKLMHNLTRYIFNCLTDIYSGIFKFQRQKASNYIFKIDAI